MMAAPPIRSLISGRHGLPELRLQGHVVDAADQLLEPQIVQARRAEAGEPLFLS